MQRRLATWVAIILFGAGVLLPTQAQQLDAFGTLKRDVSRLSAKGSYRDALPVAKRYVDAARTRFSGRNTKAALDDLLDAFSSLGDTYYRLELFDDQLRTQKEAFDLLKKQTTNIGPEYWWVLSELGDAYTLAGEPVLAEPILLQALALAEQSLGSDSDELGPVLDNLGLALLNQGKWLDARRILERATIVEGPGRINFSVGIIAGNLARACIELQDWSCVKNKIDLGLTMLDFQLGAAQLQNLPVTARADATQLAVVLALYTIRLPVDFTSPERFRFIQAARGDLAGYLGYKHTAIAALDFGIGKVQLERGEIRGAQANFKSALAAFEGVFPYGSSGAAQATRKARGHRLFAKRPVRRA
jgi:tetratricopeptide (TPR) repeat protein